MANDREQILEMIIGAVAEYRDLAPEDIDPETGFGELEPEDVLSIVREITGQLEIEAPRGCEFAQSPAELAELICERIF